MRHGNSGRKFSRTKAHRQAMMESVVTALLKHERIKTTVPKAKEARKLADRIITLGKKGSLHARREAFRSVRDTEVITKLFDGLAKRFETRKGGYTRIIRVGLRRGDATEMALLELVDRPESATETEAPEIEAQADEAKGEKAKGEKAPAKKKPAATK